MKIINKNCGWFLPFLFIALLPACRKHKYKCEGNCVETILIGQVINKVSKAPIGNQEVTATLRTRRLCLFCPTNVIGTGKSGTDGRFSFVANFDSTSFAQNRIQVSLPTPPGYLVYPEPVGPGITNTLNYSSFSFDSVNSVGLQKLSFEFYPKVLLTIKLHRATPISPEKSLNLSFQFAEKIANWGLLESASNADTSITINTSADLYTKIYSSKFNASNVLVANTDSVLCTANGGNTITITY